MIKPTAIKVAAVVLIILGLAIIPQLINKKSSEPAPTESTPIVPSQLAIHVGDGQIQLDGHSASAEHAQALLKSFAALFPDHQVLASLTAHDDLPAHWAAVTLELAPLIEGALSADVLLTSSKLTLHAVTTNQIGLNERLATLRESLDKSIQVAADIIQVDPSIPVAGVCRRAFDSFDTGAINFEESTTTLRSSAYPRLDRVIALAKQCASSSILVQGHTDASGNDAHNLLLSEQRASIVGDYIIAGGVDSDRLQIEGLGSSVAIADNATRYGRSLNRRIEIEFLLGSR